MIRNKKLIVVLAVSSLLPALTMAADQHTKDRQQILKIEQQWNEVYIKGDASPLNRIIADDYLGTEPDGKRSTKKDLIANVESSRLSGGKVNEDDVIIRYYGITAVVNGSSTWSQSDGKSGRYIWTDIFAKRGGRWQVVASQDLELEDKR